MQEDCLSSGKTLRNIRQAINTEQIGSAMYSPKFCISNVDTMTPMLPMVSANTCRNTPTGEIFHELCEYRCYEWKVSNIYLPYWSYANDRGDGLGGNDHGSASS